MLYRNNVYRYLSDGNKPKNRRRIISPFSGYSRKLLSMITMMTIGEIQRTIK